MNRKFWICFAVSSLGVLGIWITVVINARNGDEYLLGFQIGWGILISSIFFAVYVVIGIQELKCLRANKRKGTTNKSAWKVEEDLISKFRISKKDIEFALWVGKGGCWFGFKFDGDWFEEVLFEIGEHPPTTRKEMFSHHVTYGKMEDYAENLLSSWLEDKSWDGITELGTTPERVKLALDLSTPEWIKTKLAEERNPFVVAALDGNLCDEPFELSQVLE